MRLLRLGVLAGITVAISTTISVQPAFAPSGPDHPRSKGCVNRAEFRAKARHVMHQPTLQNGHKLRALIRCANAPKAARAYLNRWHRWRREHRVLLAARREWAGYKVSPMPWCTWGPESGSHLPEWSPARYTARNSVSSAGGKFQMIASTFTANGGNSYPDTHPAAMAPPLEQERVARRVLASQGLGAWVNC